MGFIFQDGALLSNISVFDNIALPLRYHYNMPLDEIEEKVLPLLEHYELAEYRDMMPGHLSVGQRKLLGIIRTIAMEPKIVFTDEPVGITDAIVRQRVTDTLVAFRDDPEITVVSVTHNIDLVKQYADYIGILHEKRLFAYDERNAIVHSRDPVLHRLLSIIIDEAEDMAEGVLEIMEGTGDAEE
jgi:phospholipid/cholesterol/gamma-HCH transport system ATP-binding protein